MRKLSTSLYPSLFINTFVYISFLIFVYLLLFFFSCWSVSPSGGGGCSSYNFKKVLFFFSLKERGYLAGKERRLYSIAWKSIDSYVVEFL
jgi:hypothetical protein